jgi:hypothetical protein
MLPYNMDLQKSTTKPKWHNKMHWGTAATARTRRSVSVIWDRIPFPILLAETGDRSFGHCDLILSWRAYLGIFFGGY